MSAPFFSILLPTRNRSEIVGAAVRSVLAQSETDWELVVSDNDESPAATREVVAAFTDPRVRYLRTGGALSMHDNWENALRHATGRWVLVLEDKQRLTPGALAALRTLCASNPGSIVSYPFVIATRDDLPGPRDASRARRYSCEAVVEEFCGFTPLYWDIFPRALTSCAPRGLYDRARLESPTGMAFSYINPDYASGFQLLSLADDLVYLPEPVIIVPPSVYRSGKSYSNGQAGMRKAESFLKFMATLPVSREAMLEGLPVRTEFLWVNPVLYDFRVFYRRPGHRPEVDWARYHAQCLNIMMLGRLWGADMRPEFAEFRRSLRQRGMAFAVRVAMLFAWRTLRAAAMRLRNRLRH